jgi:hypothetical protein
MTFTRNAASRNGTTGTTAQRALALGGEPADVQYAISTGRLDAERGTRGAKGAGCGSWGLPLFVEIMWIEVSRAG